MEFYIGTIIGLIGIALAIPPVQKHLSIVMETDTVKLFNNVVDRKLSDKDRQKYLRRLNSSLKNRYNLQINKIYITSFILENRGKEAVIEDICRKNDIFPSQDICKFFLGFDSKSLRAKFNSPTTILQNDDTKEKTDLSPIVYISDILPSKYPKAYAGLMTALKKHGIPVKLIKGTKDIWCRDYMPVITPSGKLIQFRYDPSYLKNEKYEKTRSDTREICRYNGLEPVFSKIIMDGGNILIHGNKALVSDRIYDENPEYERKKLVDDLSEILECEIIVIPSLSKNEDFTGHVDGMLRWVDNYRVVGNYLNMEYKYWKDGVLKELARHSIEYLEGPLYVHYNDKNHPDSALGVYLNWLEVGNIIFVPVFGIDKTDDTAVIDFLKAVFPDRTIESVDFNEVAVEGGLLNCATWTM